MTRDIAFELKLTSTRIIFFRMKLPKKYVKVSTTFRLNTFFNTFLLTLSEKMKILVYKYVTHCNIPLTLILY